MEAEPNFFAVVLAAGKSSRFGQSKKEYSLINDRSVLDLSLDPFLKVKKLSGLIIVSAKDGSEDLQKALSKNTKEIIEEEQGLKNKFLFIIEGGETRQDSVRIALEKIYTEWNLDQNFFDNTFVLIHDGARPFLSEKLCRKILEQVVEKKALIPAIRLPDSPKKILDSDQIIGHYKRADFVAAQTPQAFHFLQILSAHKKALAEKYFCTDDSELWTKYQGPLYWIEGEVSNRKITFAGDLPKASNYEIKIGEGWDIHRLVRGKKLVIGGLEIPFDLGEDGHSDGDVLLHAIIDAAFGASCLGDIGRHFPNSDQRWKDIASIELLKSVQGLINSKGFYFKTIDSTVILEKPKLANYIEDIRSTLAYALDLDIDNISVKAKTAEGLGPVGEGRAIEARALVVLIFRA